MEFYQTQMGHIFFEHQVPQLINALNTLAASLTKPTPAAALPVSADPNFLHDLFFGHYEPETFAVSPKFQQLNKKINQAHKSLEKTLSEDGRQKLEEYEAAVSERSIAVMEQAYKDGVCAAVQMIMAGLSYPTVEQTEAGHDC